MWVCQSVHMCGCVNQCTCVGVSISAHVWVCQSVHMCVCVCMSYGVSVSVCICVCILVCLSICVSVCHTRILSRGPPKQADIAMRGKPCLAIVKLEMASEGGRATRSQFTITEHAHITDGCIATTSIATTFTASHTYAAKTCKPTSDAVSPSK